MFNKNKTKKSSDVMNEISEIGKQFKFRISTPYGYFPEDVDPIVKNQLDQIKSLEKENARLSSELQAAIKQRDSMKAELIKLQLDIQTMEIPDTSTAEDFNMLGRLESVNDKVGSIPADGNMMDGNMMNLDGFNQPRKKNKKQAPKKTQVTSFEDEPVAEEKKPENKTLYDNLATDESSRSRKRVAIQSLDDLQIIGSDDKNIASKMFNFNDDGSLE